MFCRCTLRKDLTGLRGDHLLGEYKIEDTYLMHYGIEI